MAQLTFTIIAISAITAVYSVDLDYYWKDYTGDIPKDAVIGGQDLNGDNIYVGQAYIPDGGIIVVQIHANQTEVSVPYYGVKKSRAGVKVLCGTSQKQFSWMRSNSTQLGLDLTGKTAVTGGVENGIPLQVGRVFNNGEIKIGKIGTFNPPNATCYFVSGDSEVPSLSYEVLLYNPDVTVSGSVEGNVIPV